MSTTVTYKGSVIATVSNAVKKLLTKGKYLEDDITITDSGGGGSANLETLQVSYTPSETAISDTQTPSQGYDGFDEAQISVAAIPSSYVGSGITRRDSTDMSAVGDTVTAPAGYYENAGSKAVPAGSVTAPATITGTNADKFLGSGRLALQKAVNVTPVVSTPGYVNAGTAGESTVLLASDIIVESAQDYHPSTQDQTIAANKYLYGAQTIKAVQLTNLLAANIKKDVVIEIGDSTDSDCVTSVTGTYEGSGGDPNENVAKLISGTLTTVNCGATAVNASMRNNAYIQHVNLPLCTALTTDCFYGDTKLLDAVFPSLTTVPSSGRCFYNCNKMTIIDLGSPNRICGNMFLSCSSLATIILRKTSVITLQNVSAFSGTKFASGGAGGTIYIPKSLFDHLGDNSSSDYKKATNWATVNGYGTITWKQIEGSYYETHYADGTLIS